MDTVDDDAVRQLAKQLGDETDIITLYQSLCDRTASAEVQTQYLRCVETSHRSFSGRELKSETSPDPAAKQKSDDFELQVGPELEPEPEPEPELEHGKDTGTHGSANAVSSSQIELIPRGTSDRNHQRLTGSIGVLNPKSAAITSTKRQSMLNNRGYRISGQVQKPVTN